MLIFLKKTESGGHETTAQRADGITVSTYGNDHPHSVPHELAHYILEDHLRMPWGFWGCIAKGMLFRSMVVLEGDSAAAAAKSESVTEDALKRINIAEVLFSAFEEMLPLADTTTPDVLRQKMVDQYAELGEAPLQDIDFPVVKKLMAAAADDWAAVPIGGTLTRHWQVPIA